MWHLIELKHAFDGKLLQKFCKSNQISASKLLQTAWAVILAIFMDSEEVYSAYMIVKGSIADSVVYCCTIDSSKRFIEVLRTVEEFMSDNLLTHKLDMHRRAEAVYQATLMGIVPRNELVWTKVVSLMKAPLER